MSDIATPSIEDRTGFILAEEEALKRYLADTVRVPSRRGPARELPVTFRWTSSERAITYPYLMIDLVDVSAAYDLWHSEVEITDTPSTFFDDVAGTSTDGQYYPSTTADATPDPEADYSIGRYLPYRLTFQISSFSNSTLDDKYIHSCMLVNVLPPRSFWIPVQADQVWRRGELVSWNSIDRMESMEATKRVFHKVYTITMESEIPTTQILEISGRVERLHVDIYDLASETPLPNGHDADSPDHSQIAGTFDVYAPPSGP